jgi:hypothetical protein
VGTAFNPTLAALLISIVDVPAAPLAGAGAAGALLWTYLDRNLIRHPDALNDDDACTRDQRRRSGAGGDGEILAEEPTRCFDGARPETGAAARVQWPAAVCEIATGDLGTSPLPR